MTEVKRYFSGAPWEKRVGYCRAIESRGHVFISGTTALDDDGRLHAPGDAYRQALRCFAIIQQSLAHFGANLSNVVRTRMFVTDISQWESFGRAHQEFFGNNPPATSMIEVKGLIDPHMLIEVEVDAIT